MSLDTLTTDEFMELTPADHEAAIDLYQREVTRLNTEAAEWQNTRLSPGSQLGQLFDKMCSYLCLRKVHLGRLEEMKEDAVAAATDGSTPATAACA